MSLVEVRDRSRDSPARARSLLTVRAAISSARSSDAPCSRSLSLMCSYCRPRLLDLLTPRGGIFHTSIVSLDIVLPTRGEARLTAGGAALAAVCHAGYVAS